MPRSTPALRIDLARARAHWHQNQGLAEPVKGTLDEVIARTGWPRTLGGVDVYIAVRARVPGMRRSDLDEAVAHSSVQVIPAVRGCIYVVPRSHVPLMLRVAAEQSRKRTVSELAKVGVPEKEIAEIGEAVVLALKKGPCTPDALRKALPEGVVRSLGEKGKKIGISSPLPTALRHLEFEGRIERTLETGRLDSERYAWRLTKKNPFAGAAKTTLPADPNERNAAVARVFFRHAGPASAKDFACWAGLSQRDAKAAIDRVALVPIAVEGYADDAFALEDDLPALREAAPPATAPALLSFEDNFMVLHGGPALLTDKKHHDRTIGVWGQPKDTTIRNARHMSNRALFEGDRLIGMWEFDPDAGEIVIGTFDKLTAPRREAIETKASDLAAFFRDELGHARSFSLDTTEAVRERAAAIKVM